MTYASANRRPNAAALAGALGIPGAFGALLVAGLAVTVVNVPDKPRLTGETVTQAPLPPPPPTPDKPQPDQKAADSAPRPAGTTTTAPTNTLIIDPMGPLYGSGELPGLPIGTGDLVIPQPVPSASPFDPVGARPTGNQGRWVTNEDYRPRWIMEEMAGRAAFTLAIDARGRVTGCTITRSTGHAPLDAATCDLVTKRARFDAARDSSGKPVAGSYSGSVTWQIP